MNITLVYGRPCGVSHTHASFHDQIRETCMNLFIYFPFLCGKIIPLLFFKFFFLIHFILSLIQVHSMYSAWPLAMVTPVSCSTLGSATWFMAKTMLPLMHRAHQRGVVANRWVHTWRSRKSISWQRKRVARAGTERQAGTVLGVTSRGGAGWRGESCGHLCPDDSVREWL